MGETRSSRPLGIGFGPGRYTGRMRSQAPLIVALAASPAFAQVGLDIEVLVEGSAQTSHRYFVTPSAGPYCTLQGTVDLSASATGTDTRKEEVLESCDGAGGADAIFCSTTSLLACG